MLESFHSDWLLGICSVLFDIDVGQKVLDTYPPGALTAEEESDIAFHAFPDSLSAELHSRTSVRDSTFFFRIKRKHGGDAQAGQGHSSKPAEQQRHYSSHQSEVLYGFVFCRQRQDDRLQRGAEQQSVVLLSAFPYSSVLAPLCQYAGPLYFNRGAQALQEVYDEVLEWPPPCHGVRSTVSMGGRGLLSQVPDPATLPPPAPESGWEKAPGPSEELLGPFFEADVFTPLRDVLDQAWTIWEMVVTAQPILIVAPSPGECCNAVAALLAIATPLPYSTDFRPYFTIHDAEYALLAAGAIPDNSNALPRLLGVTNLYFLKGMATWPNVLATGRRPPSATAHRQGGPSSAGSKPSPPPPQPSRFSRINRAVRRRSAQSLLSDYAPSLWCNYKPLTRPDKQLLDRLVQPEEDEAPAKAARIRAANSSALRKHFLALTQALLEPLLPFCSPPTAAPAAPASTAQNGDGSSRPPSPLASFSHAAFLEGLQANKKQISHVLLERFPSRAACVQFYRRFLESPNFSSWLERRRQAALAAEAHQQALDAGSLPAVLSTMSDVQLIERFAQLETALDSAGHAPASAVGPGGLHHQRPPRHQLGPHTKMTQQQLAAEEAAALKAEALAVFEAMPRDLQHAVLSSPSRAALLHRLSQSRPRVPGHVQAQLR
ncbi:hypothetical protein WJX73_001357 [Symbiochloris irregularis]|uniref:UDENN domain-containing protein n=1 Tax=Symbiochloris irregularis TaxID=706552 RepID=A0AAW1PCS1_9CHLO